MFFIPCKILNFKVFFCSIHLSPLFNTRQHYSEKTMWLGQQKAYSSACPNLDFYLASLPRQLQTSLNSCPLQFRCREQSIAEAAAAATAGLTLDVSLALLCAARDGYQSNDEERDDEWAGYTSDLLNILGMLPERHRNESIRVRCVHSP
jgi:hypothetical protein